MQAHPLQGAEGAIVIGAGHGGAGHHPHIGQAAQFGLDRGDPVARGCPVQLRLIGQKAAAQLAVLFGQDHIGPGTRGGQRRRQPRRAGADDQKVAEGKGLLVMPLVMLAR